MSLAEETFSGAFADPVHDAQTSFRILMDCMARPGTVGTLKAQAKAPQPLGRAQAVIALTLADHDTAVYLGGSLQKSALPAWFAFHTGAPVTSMREEAHFAFIEAGAPLPVLSAFARGTQDYPDRSTTIVFEVESMSGGPELALKGPGIKGTTHVSPRGLPPLFPTIWADNRKLFPRGVDLILTHGAKCLCLPRSTEILPKEDC